MRNGNAEARLLAGGKRKLQLEVLMRGCGTGAGREMQEPAGQGWADLSESSRWPRTRRPPAQRRRASAHPPRAAPGSLRAPAGWSQPIPPLEASGSLSMTWRGSGRPQPPPPPPFLPQLSPPPGRHTHTRTDSLTMSLRVWLCCNRGDKQRVDGWSPPWGPTCPTLSPPTSHHPPFWFCTARGRWRRRR